MVSGIWRDTRLLDLFGIELPIIAAPMANFAGVDLAVAVAEAGGLGSLPCAALSPDQIRSGGAEFRSRSNKPLNFNFFCHAVSPPDLAKDRACGFYLRLGGKPVAEGAESFGDVSLRKVAFAWA